MSSNLWKSVAGPALVIGLASPFLANCEALGALGGSCDELKTGDFANFKLEGAAADVQLKFKGLLEGIFSLDKLAVDLEAGLIASCKELGASIGMADAELAAEPGGGEGAKKVCEAVAAKVSATLKASAGVKLSLEIGEPKCYADIDTLTKCFADCGVTVSPGEFKASCEGGEIAGTCEADCKGSCSAEGGVQCTGQCGGTCDGKCEGKDSKGKCEGKCEGKCDGGCKMEGSAKCEGTCSGECSVEMKAPQCTGEFKPPSVSVDCQANCSAKALASARCDPPSVNIKVEGTASADVEKLVAGLQVSLPKIVKLQIGLGKKAIALGEGLVKGAAELPTIAQGLVGQAMLKGGVCATMAAEMAGSASGSLSVSVNASASVGGSASGGT